MRARTAAGISEDAHFDDLRHPGNTLASQNGASTRELMTRMGHSSTRAALIYQHMTSDRDRAVADRMGAAVRGARPAGDFWRGGHPGRVGHQLTQGPVRAGPAFELALLTCRRGWFRSADMCCG
ncbi:hypothetical protein [Kitasatospora purpeofusca]|uniref:hypothetical protein n=1 Tax=Kitasatospora purpeofusca TaxID=67352 RepID=UPI002A599FD1|nr:hypothetical protein [Kitasatospora purpeofusca]MDY0814042.1 hypothetical protein [Kitasatospora purpeofusca]